MAFDGLFSSTCFKKVQCSAALATSFALVEKKIGASKIIVYYCPITYLQGH
jgi:hypothetical protein